MQVENHKEEVPFAHYEEKFRKLDAGEAAARLGCPWDGQEFTLPLLGRTFAIRHPEYAIRPLDGGAEPPKNVQTFLLRYLLEGKKEPWLGTWKTFREMPWGELYIQPYTGRVLTRAAYTFGNRLDGFRAAAQKLGGEPVNHGDAGFRFRFLPGYDMQILLWEGDAEFPPSAQVLYSDNFSAFAAEDRVVAGDILISMLKDHLSR